MRPQTAALTVLILAAVPVAAQPVPATPSAETSRAPLDGSAERTIEAQNRHFEVLQRKIDEQRAELDRRQERIDHLETKVGLPVSAKAWTWFLVGMVGEGVFFLRFVVQWWATERQRRTVVPMAFWHLSLAGTALVLAYAAYLVNPVFMLAYSLNIIIYVRNLVIARRQAATP